MCHIVNQMEAILIMNILDKLEHKFIKNKNAHLGKKIYKSVINSDLQYGLSKNPEPIIISMTSYFARYNTISLTLKSLLNQTYKPDKIIVWLDDTPQNQVTEEMTKFERYGVEYRYKKENLMPHKKYFYAMQEYHNALVITVDNDLIYSSDLVESLVKMHKKYPNCICARRVHKIQFNSDENITPYKEWIYEYRKELLPSHLLLATGCGGVLYPASIMPEETFDIKKIQNLCLKADDIWLKIMELKAGVKVVWVPSDYVMPYEIKEAQNRALNTNNTNAGGNDKYIQKLLSEYPEAKEVLLTEWHNQELSVQ